MKCEYCGKEHDGSYGSGRFCSSSCARKFSSNTNRETINRKISQTIKSKYQYVEHNNKQITAHRHEQILEKREKIENRKNSIKTKRLNLIEDYNLNNSPYKDFDTIYVQYDKFNDKYLYLTQHDENNKIIKRAKIYEYRYNIELELGRKLNSDEIIHHIDLNHFNNDRNNLIILSRKIHGKLHGNILTINEIIDNNLYIYK